jgi:hypothetical protein
MYGFFRAFWEKAPLEIVVTLCVTICVLSFGFGYFHEDYLKIKNQQERLDQILKLSEKNPSLSRDLFEQEARLQILDQNANVYFQLLVMEAYSEALKEGPEAAETLLTMSLMNLMVHEDKEGFRRAYRQYLEYEFAKEQPESWLHQMDYRFREDVMEELTSGQYLEWEKIRAQTLQD